jgi:hypothetical protein
MRLNLIPVQGGKHGWFMLYALWKNQDWDAGEAPKALLDPRLSSFFHCARRPFSGLGGQRSFALQRSKSLKRPNDRDRSSKRFEVYWKVVIE